MIEENSKLKERLDEEARIFACDPKDYKSYVPIHRSRGYKAGAIHEIKRSLVLIDQLLLTHDSELLKTLRRQILDLTPSIERVENKE
jgi:hypothetical protein